MAHITSRRCGSLRSVCSLTPLRRCRAPPCSTPSTQPALALQHFRLTHELAAPGTRTHDAGAAFGARVAVLLDQPGLAAELIEPSVDRWIRNREITFTDITLAIGAALALAQESPVDARMLAEVARTTTVSQIFRELIAHLDEKLDPAVQSTRPLTYDEALAKAAEYVRAAGAHHV